MAGPYYIANWTKGKSLSMKRNPNYKGKRPHNLDGINWVVGNSPDATQLRIQNGDADLGGSPTSAYAGIAKQYGVNTGRFWVLPAMSTWYLGLGIQLPTASWGNLLQSASQYYLQQPWLMVWPGLAVLFTTLAFNLLGDGLRDAFDPRANR
jgi:ABC-type transport system substrate-binding protein